MSEVVPGTQHEYWRPPAIVVPQVTAIPIATGIVNVCRGCQAEFMVGSHFCHNCGTARYLHAVLDLGWTRHLEFHNIKLALGLPNASFVAFLLGVACLLAALMVGMFYNPQNSADFATVQSYRMQWLLGAVAAFVAGILLKPGASVTRKS
jgi:hypothetical protein